MTIATQQPASAAFRKIAALEARIADLEAALRPFARLTKVEQARTAVLAENDMITVVVRVGDIEAARAALLAGEEKP